MHTCEDASESIWMYGLRHSVYEYKKINVCTVVSKGYLNKLGRRWVLIGNKVEKEGFLWGLKG